MLKSFKIYTCSNGSLGLHLSRAPWDPYPWVSSIQKDSTSYLAGLRVGDCLLEMNGNDVLGLKISDIAGLLKNHWLNGSSNHVSVVIWRNKTKDVISDGTEADADDDEDEENNAHNINQQSLQKFATCLQHIAQLLECPVCLEVIKPPGWQCCNGHVLCNNCRSRSEKCPVCRVPMGPRGRCLLSDKLFTLLAESFPCDGVRSNSNSPKDKRKYSTDFHNQPKITIAQHKGNCDKTKHLTKAEPDMILRSLRVGGIRRAKLKKDESQDGQQIQQDQRHNQSLRGVLNAIVEIKSNDNGSTSHGTTPEKVEYRGSPLTNTASICAKDEFLDAYNELQCYCRACYKSTEEVETSNKCTVNIYSVHHSQQQAFQEEAGKHKTYQCPTGKLCCLQPERNVIPSNMKAVSDQMKQQMAELKNNLSTNRKGNSHKALHNEWEILAHLTQDHHLAVNQYYAEFGQRIIINQDVLQSKNVICLNIRSNRHFPCKTNRTEKFFVAFVPMSEEQSQWHRHHQSTMSTPCSKSSTTKVATFIWHMNTLPSRESDDNFSSTRTYPSNDSAALDDDEVSNFDAIIENPKTGIKWFGRAHCLTTPWSQIHHKQHFLMHEVMEGGQTRDATDAFVIVIKEKL